MRTIKKLGFSLLLTAALAIVGWPILSSSYAALSGTNSRSQNEIVAVGQLKPGMSTGTASSNAVTINNSSGIITTEALTTAAGAVQAITLTSDRIEAGDIVLAAVSNGTSTAGTPVVTTAAVTASTAVITIQNVHASNAVNGTLKIGFFILKSGNAN